MYRTMILAFFALGLAICLMGPAAAAQPEAEMEVEAPPKAESSDEDVAKSLIGKDYEGELEIEGWMNFGGGLVSPPIYVHHYQREDGTSLILTSKESGANFVVTDALIISKPWKGYFITMACTKGEDLTLRFIGDARGPDSKEWWTEVRRAWEIAVEIETEPETEGSEPEADGETKTGKENETETGSETELETEPQIEPGKITEANTRGVKCANPDW